MMQFQRHTIIHPACAMSLDEVRRKAPSIFAEAPHEKMSRRYTLIPTSRVLKALQSEGFVPTRVMQARVKNLSGISYAKHMVRLRHVDFINQAAAVNGMVPEIVLVNSHDGSSSYQLHCGLYRFVCSNGMVVSDGCIGSVSIRHSGDVVNEVIEGVYDIVSETPKMIERVDHYRGIEVDDDEAIVLAESALDLKYEPDSAPLRPKQLILPRRVDDLNTDLWTRLNVIQENLLQGGINGYASTSRRRVQTRPVKSVGENVRLNKALWKLTDRFAELKRSH